MPAVDDFVSRLFAMPGDAAEGALDLRSPAADAMGSLIWRAAEAGPPGGPLARLQALLPSLPARDAQHWLTDPVLASGLHNLAPGNRVLEHWHRQVAATNISELLPRQPRGQSAAGNLFLPLLLQADPSWVGELLLSSDELGRVRFPASRWSATLFAALADHGAVLAAQPIHLELTAHAATFALGSHPRRPLLRMPRCDLVSMVVGRGSELDASRYQLLSADARVTFQLATPLRSTGGTGPHYEPVSFLDFEGHAACTGAIVSEIIRAIGTLSPVIHKELGRYIRTVRGFELLRSRSGVVASFSDPTLPGILSINVGYSENHEPCVSPFCFTWFGHELGHTKNYLIESIAYEGRSGFVTNPQEMTERIPRYDRALPVRAVLQIPYVHLYEWSLLMDFCAAGLERVPWEIIEDPIPVGDDLQAEVADAFKWIRRWALLTPLGEGLVDWLMTLNERATRRWREVRGHLVAVRC